MGKSIRNKTSAGATPSFICPRRGALEGRLRGNTEYLAFAIADTSRITATAILAGIPHATDTPNIAGSSDVQTAVTVNQRLADL